jgi:hypothetical protein
VLQVVPRTSAVLPGAQQEAGMAKHHKTLTKFSGKDDDDFQDIAGQLKLMVMKAPDIVAKNWEDGKWPNST